MRVYSLRDQTYRPDADRSRADGPAPLQSVEGLSLGVDLVGPLRARPGAGCAPCRRSLPDDIGAEIVEPAVHGVIYKTFARYTVREIFSTKRAEIQQAIENELSARSSPPTASRCARCRWARSTCRADYRRGMDGAARRGARDREDALHAGAQGKARQGDRARRRGREGAPREGRRGRRARADHRRQGAGRGDEARAALQAAPDRAAHSSRPRPRRSRASRTRKAARRRAGSRRAAKPTRARSSPTPRPTASSASARSTPSRWRAKARSSRSTRC